MDKSEESKAQAKKALRKSLLEQRLNLPDRLQQADLLQQVMRMIMVTIITMNIIKPSGQNIFSVPIIK